MKNFFSWWPILIIWLTTATITLASVCLFFNYHQSLLKNQKLSQKKQLALQNYHYHRYISQPKVLSETALQPTTEDAVPTMVKNYLKKYQSPMLEAADELVTIARKYELDPFLLLAIAQCESNLGKKMPPQCYNPFGWGIHSAGTLCFSSWTEGFEKVAQGLRQNYLNKGLEKPEEMMLKYNLNSVNNANGKWAKCVKKFLEEITLQ